MDVMQLRRVLMMGMQTGGLPGAYRRVEFLESDGNQQINTNITGLCDFHITAKSEYASGTRILVGRFYTGGHYIGTNTPSGTQTTYWSLGAGINTVTLATEWADMIVSFASNTSVSLSVNDEVINRVGSANNNPYTLFGNDIYKSIAKMKRCVCFQNGAIVTNFVPCVRKSDSKPGMYDTVSKTFYTNAGTGEFIVPN